MRFIISIYQKETLKRKLSHLFKGGVEEAGGEGGGLLAAGPVPKREKLLPVLLQVGKAGSSLSVYRLP